ncbi:222_t:CDS:2 [Rhizophagus irregularis]|nr:222_t:CDS:2 [Rhizophagus irregularis]
MRVEGNEIVLGEHIMLNLHNELILDNGEPMADNITMNSVENNELILDNDEPMTNNITMDSMIEEIENDRAISEKKDDRKKGCIIIGSPDISKTHFSSKNMDVIKYPQGLGGEFPINSFYITDSVIPSLCTTKFTFLVTVPKNDLWHEFAKHCVWKYYAPIWIDWEIWNVWEWDKRDYKHKIPKEQCDAYMYLRNDGGDLKDNSSGKAIHIYPSSDFKNKQYVIALKEILKALYDHYAKNTKDIIINVIKNFAKTGPLAGKLFELLAHDILQKGGKFKVRRLTKDINEDSEKLPVEELTLKGLTHKQFRKIDEISSECYNISDSPNFKSIDSIAPDCDGTHYLYQMTIADKHSIKVKSLSELESKINDYQLINLYFVVPNINDLFDDFCEQKYVTTADTEYIGWDYTTSWIKQNLTQYVLKINLSDF